MRRKKRVKRLYKWETAQRERRALYAYLSQKGLAFEEQTFVGGVLFALEWMQGRTRSAPSKYLLWVKRYPDWRSILTNWGSGGYRP